MSDIHIDDFYKDVGLIFIHLYANFPRKTTLYVDDISGPDTPDDFGLHSDRFLACFGTMVWLKEHGYIDFEAPIKQEAIDQANLSHKAFLMLASRSNLDFEQDDIPDHLPHSVKELAMTNVAQLRKAIRSRSSMQIRKCVHYLLSTSAVYD